MKYYAAITKMLDLELNNRLRPEHLDYLKGLGKQGKIFAKGKFTDETGGMVIYKGESLEEIRSCVENDPFIKLGARSYEIHEWEMTLAE